MRAALLEALRLAQSSTGAESLVHATRALDLVETEPHLHEPRAVRKLIALLERLHRGRAVDAVGAALRRARSLL